MFLQEELEFMEALLEDELSNIVTKRNKIEDLKKRKEFDNFMEDRIHYIRHLLTKIPEIIKNMPTCPHCGSTRITKRRLIPMPGESDISEEDIRNNRSYICFNCFHKYQKED